MIKYEERELDVNPNISVRCMALRKNQKQLLAIIHNEILSEIRDVGLGYKDCDNDYILLLKETYGKLRDLDRKYLG